MMSGAHIIASAARAYGPLIALVALSLLATWPAASGVGFVAGLLFALALALHALVFGAAASSRAFPAFVWRGLAAGGLIAACVGVGAPTFVFAPALIEGGLFAVTAAMGALVISVLFGRAPTLRDGEW
jgi:multisubunit Na+/H+ antiporter MnhB subunit